MYDHAANDYNVGLASRLTVLQCEIIKKVHSLFRDEVVRDVFYYPEQEEGIKAMMSAEGEPMTNTTRKLVQMFRWLGCRVADEGTFAVGTQKPDEFYSLTSILQWYDVARVKFLYDTTFAELRNKDNNFQEDLDELSGFAEIYRDGNKITSTQPSDLKSLDKLYAKALESDEEFKTLVKSIGSFLKLVEPDEGFHIGPMKEMRRAKVKVANDYGGKFHRLVDILRAEFVLSSLGRMVELIKFFTDGGHTKATVVRVKNGFIGDNTPGGYRDVKLNVSLSTGLVVEIQLHLKQFNVLKKNGGHEAYCWARTKKVSDEVIPEQHCMQPLKLTREFYWLYLFSREHNIEAVYAEMRTSDHTLFHNFEAIWGHRLLIKRMIEHRGFKKSKIRECVDQFRQRCRDLGFGDNHPATISLDHAFAGTLEDPVERVEELRDVLRRYEKECLGKLHPTTIEVFKELTDGLEKMGHWSEAEKLWIGLINDCLSKLGSEAAVTVDVWDTFCKRSRSYAGNHKSSSEILSCLKDCLRPHARGRMASHSLYQQLAQEYLHHHAVKELETMWLDRAAECRSALSTLHDDTKSCYNELCDLFVKSKMYPSADMWQKCLQLRQEEFRRFDLQTKLIHESFMKLSIERAVADMWQECLKIRREEFGEASDKATKSFYSKIHELFMKNSNYQAAEDM